MRTAHPPHRKSSLGPAHRRRLAWTGLVTILAMILNLFPQLIGQPMPTASAHNLQTKMNYMQFDDATYALLDGRLPGWTPGQPLLRANDEIGLYIKVIPRDGTTTGVGGHVDFYVPNGTTVVDTGYLIPDGGGGFIKSAMKGQSPIAIGDGPIGAKTTTELIGMTGRGPNINGVTAEPVVPTTGLHRGTTAGVYGDTGIFYSTDPDTAYGSWQRFTGDSDGRCGLTSQVPPPPGKSITNNSGDTFVPCNKWDAEQMFAWGANGTTFPGGTTALAGASKPIVDYADGRGNAPWGFASGVAGPESGYAWAFDWDEWRGSARTPAAMQAAMDTMGPWHRIKYPGSRISYDQPGLRSTLLGYANIDGSWLGANPSALPSTVSQTDNTSPKAIRWAVGQLTAYRPEYVWVKLRIDKPSGSFLNEQGCPFFHSDTFGGDAGGTDNGKDHLWRYYEPSEFTWNGCLALGKRSNDEFVRVGEYVTWKIRIYNLGTQNQTNLVIKDTLPSGVQFVSAVPAPTSGPNPLIWNYGTLTPGSKFEATVTVKVTGTGYLDNKVTATSDQGSQESTDTPISGNYPYLVPTKTVNETNITPGGTATYTVRVKNIGGGATGTPVTITEYLPPNFSYQSLGPVYVNGALITTTAVNTTNPNQPVFTVPVAIQGDKEMTLTFTARASASTPPGEYCNYYSVTQNSVPITTGTQACVTVGGAAIGDTVFRDWNGNGVQDSGEEGIAGIQVCATPAPPGSCATTDANGYYIISGLPAGSYSVAVTNDPANHALTTANDPMNVSLVTNQQYLSADFGYRPTGTGSIGDLVFEDKGNDGAYDGALGDVGIPGITVNLYEDTNGNGLLDPGVDALVATTTTNSAGIYGFANLATGYDYVVDVVEAGINSYFGGAAWMETTVEPHPVDNLAGAYPFADFGYFKVVPGAIGDQVFIDNNGNGTYEAGIDQPLANITVNLYRDDNGNGLLDPGEPWVQTDSSDSLGIYGFTNVPAGNYIVVVDSGDPDVPAGLAAVKQQYATNLSSGEVDNTIDFPFAQLLQKSVDKTTAVAGDTLNYTINVNYPGSTALQNVVISDSVPDGTVYVAGSANAGGFLSVDGKQVIWNLGSGGPGIPGVTAPTGTALCYASKTYNALRDTYISAANPSTNYGSASEVRTQPAPLSGRRYGLVYFDLAADPIPATAQIVIADLKMAVTSVRSNHVDEVHRMVTSWYEGSGGSDTSATGATWNDPDLPLVGASGWDGVGGPFSSANYNATVLGSFAPSTTGIKTASVVGAVKDWVNNGASNYGLVLLSTGTDTGEARYAARENGTAANRPTLTVGYYYQSTSDCNGVADLPSVADTYIQKDAQTTTAGSATTMWTNPGNSDTGNNTNHSLVRFDLAAIPPGATINSVTLKVRVVTDRDNDHLVQIRRMLTPWTEAGASWGDSNGAAAGDWAAGIFGATDFASEILGSFIAENAQQYSINLPTTLVNDWVNNAVPNQGLLLRATSTDNGDAKHGTRENTTVTNRPVLTVSWSATPSQQAQTTTTLKAEPLYRNGSGQVKVTMSVSSSGTVTGILPPADLSVEARGAVVSKVSGPAPAGPVDITPQNPSASFVYVYNVTPGSLPGTVRWTGRPGVPANTFATAASETIITAPALAFSAKVNDGVTLGSIRNIANISSRATGTKLSPDLCYIVADGAPDTTTLDQLFTMDPSTGDYVDVSANNTGTNNVEALSWNLDGTILYGVESGSLVTFDPETEAYSIVGPIGAIQGAYGTIFNPDVDSLAFDPATGRLYAVGRREDSPITVGNTLLDVLFQINPATGLRVAGAFGAGIDYVPINTAGLSPALYDVDGITFDSATGTLYGIANDSTATGDIGLADRLITINKANGAVTGIGSLVDSGTALALTDVEGLSYLPELGLIGTTGDASTTMAQRSSLWIIQSSAVAGVVEAERIAPVGAPVTPYVDWEGVACKVGPTELGAFIVPPTDSNEAISSLKASIGDRVWADLDGDGVQDPGEPGISGVTVKLYDSSGTTLLTTTITDASGIYHFYDLGAGTYKVTYELSSAPSGYQPTTPTALTVTVSGNQQYVAADFGLEPPGTGSIGDTVWLDANENGIVDPGEKGLPGVTVKLFDDMNGNGVLDVGDVLLKTTTTDASGSYGFSGLQDGKYLVQVDPGSPVTSPYGGTTTIAAAMDLVSGTNPRPVTLGDGQDYTLADFGYNWGGSIGDYVWMDNNRNGSPDPGEAPIGGAAVLLYFDANGNGILDPALGDYQIGFAQTTAGGLYLFDNLAPGKYLVDVYEDSITTDGNRNVVPTTPNVRYVALAPNQDVLTADFGYYEGALVEGNVFWDEDRNGVFDPAETGLSPVTVTLSGTDQHGNPVQQTTMTDIKGHFLFVVPVGTYTLTYDMATVLAVNPSLTEPTTVTSFTFFAEGGEDWHPVFDFGVDNGGKVGDLIWNDANGNGSVDPGEPGIGGVTVRLYADVDSDGLLSGGDKFLSALPTDASGAYLFEGLADGNYIVVVDPTTVPSGYTQTGDPDPILNNQSQATVSGGGSDLDNDFGYRPPANTYPISGTVWNDANGNGSQDGGEPGLPNVTVCLYDATGIQVLVCTTTNPNGDYSFPGQPNGSYVVKVDPTSLPSATYAQTGDPDGNLDNKTPVTVQGAPVLDQDFGYRSVPGSISGSVCAGDGDGLCEAGEPSLSGVEITLRYAGSDGILGNADDDVKTTTTDTNGDYSFPNLGPGLYQITETTPLGYTSLADRDGGNPDIITLILTLGQNAVDQDFEDRRVEAGFIGDLVWWDVNKDGIQDAEEPGIPGVTVELLLNGNVIGTDTTDAGGLYEFSGLGDGVYTVRVKAEEFLAGATLYNWESSPKDVGALDDKDSDGDPVTHEAPAVIANGIGTANTDFGFHILSSYRVTKTLISSNPARPGEKVTFEIKIENTGKTWLSLVPLQDTYSNAFLTYGFGSDFASPDSVDHLNDQVIDWTDLTGASPYGFGGDIAPGQTRTVTAVFTARTDTTQLGNTGTTNTAVVTNAFADPDGPLGPLPGIAPTEDRQASANVAINAPTGEIFESFSATTEPGGVRVNWQTVSERGILGFNIQRKSGNGQFETITAEPVLATNVGLELGAAYSWLDHPAPGRYTYRLEVLFLDGRAEPHGEARVTAQ